MDERHPAVEEEGTSWPGICTGRVRRWWPVMATPWTVAAGLKPRPWPFYRHCQELSCSVISLLSETIRVWCRPKFTSSLSASSLFGMWNQSTLAPQRGSCFLKHPWPFLPSPGCSLCRRGWRRGELPTKPKPPWSCTAGRAVVFGLRS